MTTPSRTAKTVISTADTPTSASHSMIDLYASDDSDAGAPIPSSRKPAKSRLGPRQDFPPYYNFTGAWWHEPAIIPDHRVREAVARELNKSERKAQKMQFGITKKDDELATVRRKHTETLQQISEDSKRVLDKQCARIVQLERTNVVLERKLKKKSKKAKRRKRMLLDSSSDSSS